MPEPHQLQQQLDGGFIVQSQFDDQTSIARHAATVTYTDSRDRRYETPSVLDFDLRKGTTWVDVKTIHDLTKLLDNKLSTQNNALAAIHQRLDEFGTEHEGISIYGSGDDALREYSRLAAEAKEARSQEFRAKIAGAQRRYHPPEPDDSADNQQDDSADSQPDGR